MRPLPVTLRDMDRVMEYFDEKFRAFSERMEARPKEHPPPIQGNRPYGEYSSWGWNDGLLPHVVPKDFIFPAPLSLFSMMRLWFFGDSSRKIVPYKQFSRRFDLQTEAEKTNYSSAKLLAKHCQILARAHNLFPEGIVPDINKLSLPQLNEILPYVYRIMLDGFFGAEGRNQLNRTEELSYTYLYKLLKEQSRRNNAAASSSTNSRTITRSKYVA